MTRNYHMDGTLRERWDDGSRIVTTYDETGAVTNTRPYWPDENVAADARAAAEKVRAVEATLTADTISDLKQIEAAIAKLATLLGPTTTVGSIRATIGATTDPAGTTSLRALKAQSNTAVITAASIKALIGLVIDALQLVIDGDQATRKVARQTLRLVKLQAGDLTSADVGADT